MLLIRYSVKKYVWLISVEWLYYMPEWQEKFKEEESRIAPKLEWTS